MEDVVRGHKDLLATVHGLTIQVGILDEKNKHLIERVKVLEESGGGQRNGVGKDNKLFTNTVSTSTV